jgi:hypothetical protein
MTNRTYSDLYSLISSLSGVSNFNPSEKGSILNFVNRRAYQAYRQNKVWPRYIVGAQARPAVGNVISTTFTPASKNINTASRADKLVTIKCTASVDFVEGMYVTVSGLTGSVDPNGSYQVVSVSTGSINNDTFTYNLATGTGVETYAGSGSVIANSVPEIDSFNRIWSSNPLNINSAIEYEFWVGSDGANVINNYTDLGGFWVGYLKKWEGPYTDLSTNIPLEFFEYIAHAAYADFLRMDGQIDKAIAEENVAQQYLLIELDKAETQRNNNALYRRISTYVSRQSR